MDKSNPHLPAILLVVFELDLDSQVLRWQHALAREIAGHCSVLLILTERCGRVDFPSNVRIINVPKIFQSYLRPFKTKWLLAPYIGLLCWRVGVTAAFVHMNSEWTYRLWPFLAPQGIRSLLWYAHGTVRWRLHLALLAATKVITSSPEGFRIPSAKVSVIGQGIDTELFSLRRSEHRSFRAMYVGRISPRKRIERVISVVALARKLPAFSALTLDIVGEPIAKGDLEYQARLREQVKELSLEGAIRFLGAKSQKEIHLLHGDAFVHINLSDTGSMDKSVLEALSTGCPVLTSNEGFQDLFASIPMMFSATAEPESIVKKLSELHQHYDLLNPRTLRGLVEGRHDFSHYCQEVLKELSAISERSDS